MDFTSLSYHDDSLSSIEDMFVDASTFGMMDSTTSFDGDVDDSFDANLRQAEPEYFAPASQFNSRFMPDPERGVDSNLFDINTTEVGMADFQLPCEAPSFSAAHGEVGVLPYKQEGSATSQTDSMSPASLSQRRATTSPDSASPKTPPVPEKRTRRKKVKTQEDQRRQKQTSLEKNRIAARKSRAKKKDDQQELCDKHNFLEQENLRLKGLQNEMMQELSAMKSAIHSCRPPYFKLSSDLDDFWPSAAQEPKAASPAFTICVLSRNSDSENTRATSENTDVELVKGTFTYLSSF
ncbi:hypothetical protein B7494_g1907 [Chlorociboria aeruginascens]|nr:hypothetical protein B7494_g1907 [Chlorociboria aeruginascens]